MSDIAKHIDKLAEEAALYGHAMEQYPDLKLQPDRWGQRRLVSATVNGIATDCQIKHSCGCCYDSAIEAWPFVDFNGLRIYADGSPFIVGVGSYSGEIPREGWQRELKDRGLSNAIIEKVQAYFDAHQHAESGDEQ